MPNSKAPISIVVIDDDPLQLRLAETLLNQKDPSLPVKRVLTFSDPADAVAQMPVDGVTAILCDYDMPGGSGVDWLPDLIKLDVGPVLLLTATGDEQIAASAFRCGVSDYLLKGDILPRRPGCVTRSPTRSGGTRCRSATARRRASSSWRT